MNRTIFLTITIIVFIYGCVAKVNPTDEELYKNASKSSNPHPEYHPGDFYTHKVIFLKTLNRLVIADSWHECEKKCTPSYNCEDIPPLTPDYESCQENKNREFSNCLNSCLSEKYKSKSIAEHIEGGYYSDGSYYAGLYPNFFKNIHPTQDNYNKTKWQKDRDECMEFPAEKPNYDRQIIYIPPKSVGVYFLLDTKDYHNCLKERGY